MANVRPTWSDLTPEQQSYFGNGIGPSWFTEKTRAMITGTCSWFFQEASWKHHDFGYCVGYRESDRRDCDWKFFKAMIRDALSQDDMRLVKVPVALVISIVFFLAVRLFGWYKSFEYGDQYHTLKEVLSEFG